MKEIDASKCKCWITPFEPPKGCFDICAGLAVRYANPEEMENIFHIDREIANKLFELTSNEKLVKLSDFEAHLSPDEFDLIVDCFEKIDHQAKRWFKKKFYVNMDIEASVMV